GIRMALGARAADVRRSVLHEGLRLTAAGVVVGAAGAWLMGRALGSILFHVQPLDPVVLAGSAACMFVVATAAAYLPARRATAADPMEALREA
ncbi:MAG: FtsX-like permease family protein, partial [Gemmatimonadaceae bacterium]